MEAAIRNKLDTLPVIMIGGPPHSGKSVLVYNLTHALRKLKIPHYVLRAAPDGEGDWSNESALDLVAHIRSKGRYSESFVRNVVQTIENRFFPLLVDMGGRPSTRDNSILALCTHSILVIAKDQYAESFDEWNHLIDKHNLKSIGVLESVLGENIDQVSLNDSILCGTISNLERGAILENNVVTVSLAQAVANIIQDITNTDELVAVHKTLSPCQRIIDLDAHPKTSNTWKWCTGDLERLQRHIEPFQGDEIAIYGRAPIWVYTSMILSRKARTSWLFDARLGWIMPPIIPVKSPLNFNKDITIQIQNKGDYSLVEYKTKNIMLDIYDLQQLGRFLIKNLPATSGFILSGKLPIWIIVAILRSIKGQFRWIALFQPNSGNAIVIYSKVNSHLLGSVVTIT